MKAGSVHALLGENGAGKSTLLKILGGSYRPDFGKLIINGKPLAFSSPSDALSAGIAIIHQELHTVPDLTVAENIFLGNLPKTWGILRNAELRKNTEQALSRLGMKLQWDQKVGDLSIGDRQMVEIAKAISRDAKIIAFDEPTSSLSKVETAQLFEVIESLRQSDCIVIYVSHRIEEVFAICDSATVLRDGEFITTFDPVKNTRIEPIISAMVGRPIDDVYSYRSRPLKQTGLTVSDLKCDGWHSAASLQTKRGEITGLFGLIGAGRTSLLKGILGAEKRISGKIELDNIELLDNSIAKSIDAGIYYFPEDRKSEGIFPQASVLENLNLGSRKWRTGFAGITNIAAEREHANAQINRMGIKTPNPQQLISNLSGGNQQKVIFGRWMGGNTSVMLLDEPTRGIDIGAKHEIYEIIYDLAEIGAAVLVSSSDLSELMGICDSIYVMCEGNIVTRIERKDFDSESILKYALPKTANAGAA